MSYCLSKIKTLCIEPIGWLAKTLTVVVMVFPLEDTTACTVSAIVPAIFIVSSIVLPRTVERIVAFSIPSIATSAPSDQECDHLIVRPWASIEEAVNKPSGAFVTVTLVGGGPGLNVDLDMSSFQVPVKAVT